MRVDSPSFHTHAGVDHNVSAEIDPKNLKTNIIKSIFSEIIEGKPGCENGYGNHCRLVFSNFNAVIEKLD